MKTLKKLLLFVVASALLAGCTSYKNVPYMQNPEVVNSYREDLPLYDAKIMPKDLLSITVNTSDPPVSYTHLRAHETGRNLVCRLLLEKKKIMADDVLCLG